MKKRKLTAVASSVLELWSVVASASPASVFFQSHYSSPSDFDHGNMLSEEMQTFLSLTGEDGKKYDFHERIVSQHNNYRADFYDDDLKNDLADGSDCYTNCYEACHQDCYVESPSKYIDRARTAIVKSTPNAGGAKYPWQKAPVNDPRLKDSEGYFKPLPEIKMDYGDQAEKDAEILFSFLFGGLVPAGGLAPKFTISQVRSALQRAGVNTSQFNRIWYDAAHHQFKSAYHLGLCFIDAGTSWDNPAGYPTGLNLPIPDPGSPSERIMKIPLLQAYLGQPAFQGALSVPEIYMMRQAVYKSVPSAADPHFGDHLHGNFISLVNSALHEFWACYPDDPPDGFVEQKQIDSLMFKLPSWVPADPYRRDFFSALSVLRYSSGPNKFYNNQKTVPEYLSEVSDNIDYVKNAAAAYQTEIFKAAMGHLDFDELKRSSSCYNDCYCDCHLNCHTDCYVAGCYSNGCYANGCHI